MHSRFINRSWSLLLAGLGLTACVEDELVELADPGAEVELRGGTPNYPLIPCNSANVIGELHTPNDCSFPIPSDWEMHGLFTNYTPEILAWGETRPDALKKFCAFEYVGGTPIEYGDYIDLFDAIDQSMVMHVDTVEVDCFGQTMSGLETTEIDEEFATLYHDAIQWVSGDDLQSTQQYRVLPEIAILDTASQKSHKEETEPNNMHGFFMGDIAGDIACPDGDEDCLENIVFHVAMPRDEFEPADYEDGGHQGTMGDLATALVAAVGQWREVRLDDPSKTPRLVVSLSLGWDATLNDPDRAPVRALEMALNFAACNGAIVVAASGNSPDPECPLSGALAPATYSTKLAPSEQSCIAMGFEPIDDTNYPVFGVSRTLVLAVGGVDGYDQPIINARLDSTPMLVAYASNATVFSNGDYTTPLTGTSVSAAQVAGIAALIWSYVPEATPSWIMERLYWPNEDLGVDADLYLNINYRDVRRASVCNSLEMACPRVPAARSWIARLRGCCHTWMCSMRSMVRFRTRTIRW